MSTLQKMPNAQKWTEERVLMNLIAVEKMSREDEIIYLGTALNRQGLYIQVWSYWRRKYANYDDIMEMMLRIDSLFESKLYEKALRKEVSPWVAIFSLKNNHHWSNEAAPEPVERRPMMIELDERTVIAVP